MGELKCLYNSKPSFNEMCKIKKKEEKQAQENKHKGDKEKKVEVKSDDVNIVEEIILLQRLLKGRKEQNLMYQGKFKRAELIKELNLGIEIFIHPATYLNKLLFSKIRQTYEKDLNIYSSKIYLYNINTEKQIFEYDFENMTVHRMK